MANPSADRLTIPETPRYTFDIARDVEKADQDVKAYINGNREGPTEAVTRAATQKAAEENLNVPKASWGDFGRHYRKPKNFLLLLGTAGSWFCLDVAFYGLSLNNGTILEVIGYSTKNATNVYEFLYNTAVGNIIIVLAGAVPGYWVSVATIDTLGRKTIQLGGFAILTILFIVMGFAYWHISSSGLLAIYVLAQFFFNFGKPLTFPQLLQDRQANTEQVPTPPLSSCPVRCSLPATGLPRTVSLPPLARSAPLSARAPSLCSAPAARPRRTLLPGWTTSSRSMPSSCSSAA